MFKRRGSPLAPLFAAPYAPRSPWTPGQAVAAATLMLAVCNVLLPLCLYVLSADLYRALSGHAGPPRFLGEFGSPALFLIEQATLVALVVAAAGMWGGKREKMLSLEAPSAGWSAAINFAGLAFLIMAPISVGIAFVFGAQAQVVRLDMLDQPAWLKASGLWLNLAATALGAPVSEELLFRGFLLSSLAQTRLGFWGAAVAVDFAWTLRHAPGTSASLLANFILGLVLSFVLVRTGSLWTCLIARLLISTVPTLYSLIYLGS